MNPGKLLCLIVLLAVVRPEWSKATHAAGGELYYEWVSGSTYRVILKFYRDCSGIPEDTEVAMCYYNTCTGWAGRVMLQKVTDALPNGQPVNTGCPGYPTACTGGTLPGFREWRYAGYVTLPAKCTRWLFTVSIDARNASDNLQAPPGYNLLFIEASLNNELAEGNSSPVFTIPPVPYVCVHEPYTYNSGAIDPDGDSLSFLMLQPRTANWGSGGWGSGGTCPHSSNSIGFNSSGYNLYNNPFATNNTFTFNNTTGQMGFTATTVGSSTVAMLVQEYRNGRVIGSVMRDIQIIKLACITANPSLETDTSAISGGRYRGGRIETCVQNELSFCFTISSGTSGAVLAVTDNHHIAVPGMSVTYTPPADTVTGCISWKPVLKDTGQHLLTVVVKDSTCTPPGVSVTRSFTIPVYVYPAARITGPDTICLDDSIQLHASGGNAFTWSVLNGDMNSLSCANCTSPWINPGITTTYVVRSNLSLSHCKANDTFTVTVATGTRVTTGPDIVKCKNDTVILPVSTGGLNPSDFIFRWSPPGYLDDPAIFNPACTAPVPVTYTLKAVDKTGAECPAMDTIRVDIEPGPSFIADSFVCQGMPLQLTNTSGGTGSYTWYLGDGSSAPAANVPYTYIYDEPGIYIICLVAQTCNDTAHKEIVVDKQPQIGLSADKKEICPGTDVQFSSFSDTGILGLLWDFGDGTGSARSRVSHTYKTAGTMYVTLTATHRSCPDVLLRDTVYVHPQPEVSIGNDTAICPGEESLVLQNNISTAATYSYFWSTGATTQSIQVDVSGIYWLRAVNDHDCTATDSITISRSCHIDIPNVFSPNGDGINDYFFPQGRNGLRTLNMKIFNRWGQQLFVTSNINGPGWDGKFNGDPVSEGVYIYMIEVIYTNGSGGKYQGNITLLR